MNLETMSNSELVAHYNKLTGGSVKRFSDRATALKRIAAATPTPKRETTKHKIASGGRADFNFKKLDHRRKLRAGTLRGKVADALRKGATLPQIEEVIAVDDADHGRKGGNVRARAYGAVRLLHFYVGFGMRQGEDGIIHLVE